MKTQKDFMKVIEYSEHHGFKNKTEMEDYLKKNGFGLQYANFYTDDEDNELVFKVDFFGNQVVSIEGIAFPFSFKTLKEFDFFSFC